MDKKKDVCTSLQVNKGLVKSWMQLSVNKKNHESNMATSTTNMSAVTPSTRNKGYNSINDSGKKRQEK